MDKMKVWAYSTIWNEEKLLHYYIKHYSTFCDMLIFCDNESDDRSIEIIESYPNTRIVSYGTEGLFNELLQMEIKEMAIEDARINECDYVIIGDCDEFIHHPNIKEFLLKHLDKTALFYPAGFNMASRTFPTEEGQIYDLIKTGEPNPWYSKPILLNLNLIEHIKWVEGCHEVDHSYLKISGDTYHVVPESVRPNAPYKDHKWGNWKIMFDLLHIFEKEPLKLLHYKYLGKEYVEARNKLYRNRISDDNKIKNERIKIMKHYNDSVVEIDEILNNATHLKL
tara:strand:+ start:325 stop:1167 length:843 start_codon:yes stop_codon:yes gene_type:complete